MTLSPSRKPSRAVKVSVRKGLGAKVKTVNFEGGNQLHRITPNKFYATVGHPFKPAGMVPPTHKYLDGTKLTGLTNLSEDVTLAARNALIGMIDWLVTNKNLTREHAYLFVECRGGFAHRQLG